MLKAVLNPAEEDCTIWARYGSATMDQGLYHSIQLYLLTENKKTIDYKHVAARMNLNTQRPYHRSSLVIKPLGELCYE